MFRQKNCSFFKKDVFKIVKYIDPNIFLTNPSAVEEFTIFISDFEI